jgi:hypothetical protein
MTKKKRLSTIRDVDDDFISRPALAVRWGCHIETLKRREREGILHPYGFSIRMVRYRLSEVRALEREAGDSCPSLDPAEDGWRSSESRRMKQKQMRELSIAQPRQELGREGVVVQLQS